MTPGWSGLLLAEQLEDGVHWCNCRELVFTYRDGRQRKLPLGVVSDGASIPPPAWPIIGHPMGPYAREAFMHDDAYNRGDIPKEEADELFYEALLLNPNVDDHDAWLMYEAVKEFGWDAWNAYRERDRRLAELQLPLPCHA